MKPHTLQQLFLGLVMSLALMAAAYSPSDTPEGVTSADTSAAAGATIRVMAYNIHHCNPPSTPDSIDLEAIVRTIREQAPDLVALQEVDVHTARSGPYHQAEEIAARLHMHYFFGKAIDYAGGEYGVAILSSFPLSEATVHRLPTQAGTQGEPRIVATAKVTLPGGIEIRFGSTHLDAQQEPVNRQLQIKAIGTIAAAEKLPFIVAGDFNAPPGSEVIRQLDRYFTRTCQTCPPTIPVEQPKKAIDFIAYRPKSKFKIKTHQVIPEKYASDHLPVIAVLEIDMNDSRICAAVRLLHRLLTEDLRKWREK